jgi:hypothetical protein
MMARCMRRNVLDARDQQMSLIVTKTDESRDDFRISTKVTNETWESQMQLPTEIGGKLREVFREMMRARRD